MIQKDINKKGFTLIELLAVITILGILMIIAIPGINFIILNSRKNVYVNDALTYVGAASRFAIDSNNGMDDTDTSYYIHIGNLGENEKASSPLAEWKDAYVGVIFDGKNFEYYWWSK